MQRPAVRGDARGSAAVSGGARPHQPVHQRAAAGHREVPHAHRPLHRPHPVSSAFFYCSEFACKNLHRKNFCTLVQTLSLCFMRFRYDMRYMAKVMYDTLRSKFPKAPEKDVLKVLSYFDAHRTRTKSNYRRLTCDRCFVNAACHVTLLYT